MSWKDDVQEDIEITTGDGKVYKPLYKNPKMSVSYNAVAIEFNETKGAFVARGKVSYRKFSLTMFFQGDNHLEESKAFLNSANDTNPWKVKHPYYGQLSCEPSTTETVNSSDNVTQISIELWETIDISNKKTVEDKADNVEVNYESSLESLQNLIGEMNLSAVEASKAGATNDKMMEVIENSASTEEDRMSFAEWRTKMNVATSSIASEPQHYISTLANVFRLPAKFYDNVENRIQVYEFLLNDLENAMTGVLNIDKKIYYESIGAVIIGGICIASVTNKDDIAKNQGLTPDGSDVLFKTRSGVITIASRVNEMYQRYLDRISSMQSDIDNRLDSYYPSPQSVENLRKTVYSATGNLFNISKTAKVENTMYVDRDIPLVKIVNIIYGTYSNEKIDEFIRDNNLGRDEVIMIRKGRLIKYYI